MPLFRYDALTPEGKKEIGMVNADSIELAKERLRKQKVLVIKLASYKKKTGELTLSPGLIQGFTRDLYVLLRAGLPLYDSLLTLEEKYRRSKMQPLFLDLTDQVKQGRHLSQALLSYPKIFSPVYVAMVKAGEESGTLTESFEELAKLLGKEQALKKKVVSAMIYPLFLGVFCLTVLTVLLFFLIPAMSELFEDRTLHPMTNFILNLSQTLNTHATLIFSTLALLVVSGILFFRHEVGKRQVQKLVLHLPIFKRLVTETVLARFCRVFAVLLQGGTPLVNSLRLAKAVMKNVFFENVVENAEKNVVEGKRLSEEFQKSPLIPNLVIRLLAIAEESGDVESMMQHVAEIYEEDIEKSLSRMTALLQPVMLLVLGLIVAIILLSVLLPLTDVSSII